MKLEEIAVDPADAHKIWWPLDKTFRSVDFIRQPNEVCQVTLKPKHKDLDLSRIMECFEVWPSYFVQCCLTACTARRSHINVFLAGPAAAVSRLYS